MRPLVTQSHRTPRRLALGALISIHFLFAAPAPAAPVEPALPTVTGPYLVVDVRSGEVLDEHDALRPWYPASTTKLMTAYVAFRAVQSGALTLDSPVLVSARAAAQPPSKMGFKAGSVLTLDNALKMMMVKSANDIAVAVAETVGGSEAGFAALMNAEAARLGMTRSRFVNPHGLPNPDQVSSARDMALLARALLNEFPQYRPYFAIHAIQHGKKVLKNYNTLIERFAGTTGMKTGYICASGFNLVASANRGGREVIAVVFGSYNARERAEKAAELLEIGLRSRSFFGGRRGGLEALSSGAGYRAPLDMCPYLKAYRRAQQATAATDSEEAEYSTLPNGVVVANESGALKPSRLGPKIAFGPPVRVFTGLSGDATAASAAAAGVVAAAPLPRPRPAGAEGGPPSLAFVAPAQTTPLPAMAPEAPLSLLAPEPAGVPLPRPRP